jgi:hypothetical protein
MPCLHKGRERGVKSRIRVLLNFSCPTAQQVWRHYMTNARAMGPTYCMTPIYTISSHTTYSRNTGGGQAGRSRGGPQSDSEHPEVTLTETLARFWSCPRDEAARITVQALTLHITASQVVQYLHLSVACMREQKGQRHAMGMTCGACQLDHCINAKVLAGRARLLVDKDNGLQACWRACVSLWAAKRGSFHCNPRCCTT